MKTIKSVECPVPSVRRSGRAASLLTAPGAHGVARPTHSLPNRSVITREWPKVNAFTLIEVLVVIAIIAALAALILPVAGAVKRHAFIQTAQGEMSQLETAIESYHSAYGFYPPASQAAINGVPINQLYYELVGTTNTGTAYRTLDGSAAITFADANTAFGVSGFMNCNKAGGDESAPRAQDFLPGLKPNQYNSNVTNNNVPVTMLVTADGGPDPDYKPLGASDVNPWRYAYPGTHNPGSYDLWVQLQISGKKYLVCNWSKQVQVNSPLR